MRLLIALFFCVSGPVLGNSEADSLLKLARQVSADSTKVYLLNNASKSFQAAGDFNTSLRHAKQAYQLAQRIKFNRGLSKVMNNLGTIYWNLSEFDSSLYYFHAALKVREILKDTAGIAGTLNNIGLVYSSKGDFNKVLVYYQRSLDLAELVHDDLGIANTYNNIGLIHFSTGNFPAALESFFKSLRYYEKLKNETGLANAYNNIGSIYETQNKTEDALSFFLRSAELMNKLGDMEGYGITCGNISSIYKNKKDFKNALEYQQKSVDLLRKTGNLVSLAGSLNNLGSIYFDMGNYSLALNYEQEALKLKEEAGDKYGTANSLIMLSESFERTGKNDQAFQYLQRGKNMAIELGAADLLKSAFRIESMLYKKTGQAAKALAAYEKYIEYRDSLFNKENSEKSLRAAMNFEYEKKATADSVKHAEEKRVKDAEINVQRSKLKQEQMLRYGLFGGLFIVAGFSTLLLNRFRTTRKQKLIIEHQKVIVEEKNKEIVDSINYAKRIQQALLKEEGHISSHLPEHFIFFKPKDIVSGDFYWSQERNGYWYVAAADCTGHGVPGAFMSMLGVSFLNEITSSGEVLSPAAILDQLRMRIIKELGGEHDSSLKDGMDISLIRFHFESNELLWAGANNPLWINRVKDHLIEEIKPDKQPIGHHPQSTPFTDHNIELNPGDLIYLFTDGFADQFGGDKGKKLRYKPFREFLLKHSDQGCIEQKVMLADFFTQWKKDYEQTDDVCVIALKLKQE